MDSTIMSILARARWVNRFIICSPPILATVHITTTFAMTTLVLRWSPSQWYKYLHDDVIKWKHFPRYWPFVPGIHRSPVNSPHKGQWRGALMLLLICAWTNNWVNNSEAGDLRRHRAHYDVSVMHLQKRHICWFWVFTKNTPCFLFLLCSVVTNLRNTQYDFVADMGVSLWLINLYSAGSVDIRDMNLVIRCNVITSLIARFMGPTWGPPGSCRPQMGPMLALWTLLSGLETLLVSLTFREGNHLWQVDSPTNYQ